MIYPVVVKKTTAFAKGYCGDNGTRYIAFSPMTETIFAVAPTIQGVLKKITAEFAARVFDPEIEIDVIMLPEEIALGDLKADELNTTDNSWEILPL